MNSGENLKRHFAMITYLWAKSRWIMTGISILGGRSLCEWARICMRREREGERKREREGDRQTDRQTERQTDRQTDIQTDREFSYAYENLSLSHFYLAEKV